MVNPSPAGGTYSYYPVLENPLLWMIRVVAMAASQPATLHSRWG